MSVCMVNKFFILFGVFCGILFALIANYVHICNYNLDFEKNEVDNSKWTQMIFGVEKNVIVLETYSSRITLFLDEKGMLKSFRNQDKFVYGDSLYFVDYKYEISLEDSNFFCRMKRF